MFKKASPPPKTTPSVDHDQNFFNGLITGAVLGAAAYYFFKTPEGKIIKNELLKTGKTYLDDYQDSHPQLKKKVKQAQKTTQKIEMQGEKEVNKVKKQAEKELKTLGKQITEAQKKADEMQQNLHSAASKIEKKFFTRNGRSLGK